MLNPHLGHSPLHCSIFPGKKIVKNGRFVSNEGPSTLLFSLFLQLDLIFLVIQQNRKLVVWRGGYHLSGRLPSHLWRNAPRTWDWHPEGPQSLWDVAGFGDGRSGFESWRCDRVLYVLVLPESKLSNLRNGANEASFRVDSRLGWHCYRVSKDTAWLRRCRGPAPL